MDGYLPAVFRRFGQDYPAVTEAFRALADWLHEAGPLTDRERRLAELGTAIGRESEGGVRSHARKALSEVSSPRPSGRWRCWPSPRRATRPRWPGTAGSTRW